MATIYLGAIKTALLNHVAESKAKDAVESFKEVILFNTHRGLDDDRQ